ncbi:MAG TPA: 4a-hydroxytetrahydrobiopterin dehydratase [Chloroflexi bacterium]|nr:4a-hydroxytetrahydrobiopterin dehydratase [Chloroflexota bacterium]
MAKGLADREIEMALQALPGWRYQEGKIVFEQRFDDFSAAIAFIVRVALVAEGRQHHPEIYNVYNRVRLSLSTHEAGDVVTERDIALARAIYELT